ncbi:unnamed protein product [Acanthosepion pharaonis]|uniref:Uncharacterized protein n=1 Tax=Acanthosepion pharaonis TaxID=158019 RepID=A0A812B3U8_ACAPH|nr:unnamed protein product [Sepia pharaonis]
MPPPPHQQFYRHHYHHHHSEAHNQASFPVRLSPQFLFLFKLSTLSFTFSLSFFLSFFSFFLSFLYILSDMFLCSIYLSQPVHLSICVSVHLSICHTNSMFYIRFFLSFIRVFLSFFLFSFFLTEYTQSHCFPLSVAVTNSAIPVSASFAYVLSNDLPLPQPFTSFHVSLIPPSHHRPPHPSSATQPHPLTIHRISFDSVVCFSFSSPLSSHFYLSIYLSIYLCNHCSLFEHLILNISFLPVGMYYDDNKKVGFASLITTDLLAKIIACHHYLSVGVIHAVKASSLPNRY